MRQLKITKSITNRENASLDKYLQEIGHEELISAEEEVELAHRIKNGDRKALEKLTKANLRFVVSVAKQYQNQGLSLPDLINEGNIGLMKAARRFDPTRGFRFISYAVWWIRQQIMAAISEQGRMVRLPLNQVGILNRINRARAQFEQENEREPSDRELAEFLDITPDRVGEAIRHSARHISFDVSFGEDGDGTLLDVVPDENAELADRGLQQESLRTDIQHVMMVLSPREREIVSLAFGIGCREMTLEEIGERFELTRERVRQVKEKAIRKMSRPGVRDILRQYI